MLYVVSLIASLCYFIIFHFSFYICFLVYFHSLQVYRPRPPGGNTFALNKYHILDIFPLQKNTFYMFKVKFSLPNPTHATGL